MDMHAISDTISKHQAIAVQLGNTLSQIVQLWAECEKVGKDLNVLIDSAFDLCKELKSKVEGADDPTPGDVDAPNFEAQATARKRKADCEEDKAAPEQSAPVNWKKLDGPR